MQMQAHELLLSEHHKIHGSACTFGLWATLTGLTLKMTYTCQPTNDIPHIAGGGMHLVDAG